MSATRRSRADCHGHPFGLGALAAQFTPFCDLGPAASAQQPSYTREVCRKRRRADFQAKVVVMMRRNNEASERHAERRRREDEAPRLIATVPNLVSLKLQLSEAKGDVSVAETGHIRHVVVAHAPLLFEMPCRDAGCKDGGHDVTSAITRSLKAGETQFEGEHSCTGYVGDGPCQRILRYVATATYKT